MTTIVTLLLLFSAMRNKLILKHNNTTGTCFHSLCLPVKSYRNAPNEIKSQEVCYKSALVLTDWGTEAVKVYFDIYFDKFSVGDRIIYKKSLLDSWVEKCKAVTVSSGAGDPRYDMMWFDPVIPPST